MNTPDHRNRTATAILSELIFHDAMGFAFRAASWLDYVKRTAHFAALHYASIDARLSIEHLVFEQLVITAGPALTEEQYNRCVAEPLKLAKLLNKFVPDYERLQEFNEILGILNPAIPKLNKWDIKELMKSRGVLSSYLHWTGAHNQTTENLDWQKLAVLKVTEIVDPLWEKLRTAQSGSIQLGSMPAKVRAVWDDFRTGRIDANSTRVRLELVRPLRVDLHA